MTTSTDKLALVDQLLAALRTAPRPLTAAELGLLLPKRLLDTTDCYHRSGDPNGHPEAAWAHRTIVCHGDYDEVWHDRMSQDVYPDLCKGRDTGALRASAAPGEGEGTTVGVGMGRRLCQ